MRLPETWFWVIDYDYPMDMVRHNDEFVQFNVVKPFWDFYPLFVSNHSNFTQFHLGRGKPCPDNFAKKRRREHSYDALIFPLALARERGRGEGRTLGLMPAKMIAHSFLFFNTLIGDGVVI